MIRVTGELKRASLKSISAPPKMFSIQISLGTVHAPRRLPPPKIWIIQLVSRAYGTGSVLDAELGAFLLRILLVDLKLEVVGERDERVGGFRVERLIEAPLERFERELAVAVVDDQAVDRLFANRV